MIPLLSRLWASLLYDEMAARRWLRGALVTFALAGAQLAAASPEAAAQWTRREWAVRIAFALVGGLGVMINLGQPNPKEAPHAEPPSP
jgi:hypothetical protein